MKELIAAPLPSEQRVRITDGPFREFIGALETADPLEQKLTIVVNLFGRPARVKVDREHVIKIE
jgi:transcription antitermination factor NusG